MASFVAAYANIRDFASEAAWITEFDGAGPPAQHRSTGSVVSQLTCSGPERCPPSGESRLATSSSITKGEP